jgi:hypothetical protein
VCVCVCVCDSIFAIVTCARSSGESVEANYKRSLAIEARAPAGDANDTKKDDDDDEMLRKSKAAPKRSKIFGKTGEVERITDRARFLAGAA